MVSLEIWVDGSFRVRVRVRDRVRIRLRVSSGVRVSLYSSTVHNQFDSEICQCASTCIAKCTLRVNVYM